MYLLRKFRRNTGKWREKQDFWPVYTQMQRKTVLKGRCWQHQEAEYEVWKLPVKQLLLQCAWKEIKCDLLQKTESWRPCWVHCLYLGRGASCSAITVTARTEGKLLAPCYLFQWHRLSSMALNRSLGKSLSLLFRFPPFCASACFFLMLCTTSC